MNRGYRRCPRGTQSAAKPFSRPVILTDSPQIDQSVADCVGGVDDLLAADLVLFQPFDIIHSNQKKSEKHEVTVATHWYCFLFLFYC